MPLYDYRCRSCNKVTEIRRGFRDTYDEKCAHCGGEMLQVFNPAGIVFKGSGFYITDSRKGAESSSGSKSESSSEGKSDGKSESSPAASGTKSESASTPAASPKSETAA